jgi:hypothetical protein
LFDYAYTRGGGSIKIWAKVWGVVESGWITFLMRKTVSIKNWCGQNVRLIEVISKIDFDGIFKYLAIMQDGFCRPYQRDSRQKSQRSRIAKDAENF